MGYIRCDARTKYAHRWRGGNEIRLSWQGLLLVIQVPVQTRSGQALVARNIIML